MPPKGWKASPAQRERYRRGQAHFDRTGPNNPNWKGGRARRAGGRTSIYSPNHPYAEMIGVTPYVLEYRLIAEQKLGRFLRDDEVVHHINGNPADNRPENLEVTTQPAHARYHADERRDDLGRFGRSRKALSQ